ncbi:MAG: sulfatase [Chloroflexi bacterium]|nr:sulfatase [Chloroflexota bacterium]
MKKQTVIAMTIITILIVACSSPVLNFETATPISISPLPPNNAPAPTAIPSLSTPAISAAHPNIIFVLADDLDAAEYAFMPKLQSLIADQGVTFSNFFVNVSLCCPSRSTTLRGQYAHNTRVYTNGAPDGGFDQFVSTGDDKSTIATWLQSAGYKTMLAGKYLNGYPGKDKNYIPPGWSEWYSAVIGDAYSEFNYTLNENGKMVHYGKNAEDYGTDVYTRKAVDFIQRAVQERKPFFVYLGYYAPHSPSTPAPRHEKLFANVQAPRVPSFNETDVSDKPGYIRDLPLLTTKEQSRIDDAYRKRLQSIQAVDDAIETLVAALKTNGQLDNTYIFFGSDNGFHLGQHRLAEGKQAPYEEDIRVPMSVRGPGVPIGKTVDALTGNVDYAETWAQLAGATLPDFVDGRSLVPLWNNISSSDQWRQVFLLQHGGLAQLSAPVRPAQPKNLPTPRVTPTRTPIAGVPEPDDAQETQITGGRGTNGITPFVGLRTKDFTYVEYTTGEKELYDLKADPYQLQNIATKSADVVKQLAAILAELRKCAGAQ